MIILSGVLMVPAIALLVVGIIASNGDSAEIMGVDALTLIYISIAISIVSALCLAIGVWLRRKELFGTPAGGTVAAKKAKTPKEPKGRKARKAAAAGGDTKELPKPAARDKKAEPAPAAAKDEAAEAPIVPAQPVEVPDDAVVHVVRGRKRYHLDNCRQLAGREKEELTYAEAIEEGFSPCTACMPDTALAARAAAAGPLANGDTKTAVKASATLTKEAAPAPPPAPPSPPPAEQPPAAPAPAEGAGSADSTDKDVTAELPATPPAERPAPPAEPATPPATRDDMAVIPEPPPEPAEASSEATEDTEDTEAPESTESAEGAEDTQSAGSAEDEDEGPQVRILSGTKRYHRADCALIEDIGDDADDLEALSRAQAKARGCTPCLVCQPDKEHARD